MRFLSQSSEDASDIPPLKLETGHQGKEAERLTRFIWKRIQWLVERGKEAEACALVEEFDEFELWDDPLA